MIAIDVTMVTKNQEIFNVEEAMFVVTQSYENIHNFFKNCIDQNIILNATVNVLADNDFTNITRYFATTVENAQAFQTAFADMSAEFSMKKMWDENGFDISFEQYEINFDNEIEVSDLIGSNGEIWDVLF
jgi:hypothetical protein